MSGGPAAKPVRKRRWARGIALRLGAVAAVVAIMRWTSLIESNVFYHPTREQFATPAGCEDVWFMSKDGVRLHGWFIRARDAAPGEARPAVLHCHGNAGNVDAHLEFSEFLAEFGVHVFIFDYRGYGRSDRARMLRRGELMADARAALDALAARTDVLPGRVGAYGVSLGGAFASELAAEDDRVAALCTLSAFSSWSRVAGDHVPVLGRLVIGSGLDPVDAVTRLGKKPLLVVHGDADTIVPSAHAVRIVEAAKSAGAPVSSYSEPGGDHNSICQSETVKRKIGEFFRSRLSH